MMVGIEKVVIVHEGNQLLEHGSLQHLAQDGEDGHRSVVLGVQLATFPFIEWHNFGNLPLCWKLVGLKRKVDNVTYRRYNKFLGDFQDEGVKVVQT